MSEKKEIKKIKYNTITDDDGEKSKVMDIESLEMKEGKYVVPLTKNVVLGSETYTELLFNEPKAKHMKNLDSKTKFKNLFEVLADMAEVPDVVIDELIKKDMNTCMDFFNAFD